MIDWWDSCIVHVSAVSLAPWSIILNMDYCSPSKSDLPSRLKASKHVLLFWVDSFYCIRTAAAHNASPKKFLHLMI